MPRTIARPRRSWPRRSGEDRGGNEAGGWDQVGTIHERWGGMHAEPGGDHAPHALTHSRPTDGPLISPRSQVRSKRCVALMPRFDQGSGADVARLARSHRNGVPTAFSRIARPPRLQCPRTAQERHGVREMRSQTWTSPLAWRVQERRVRMPLTSTSGGAAEPRAAGASTQAPAGPGTCTSSTGSTILSATVRLSRFEARTFSKPRTRTPSA
jgi:hypothetical protein